MGNNRGLINKVSKVSILSMVSDCCVLKLDPAQTKIVTGIPVTLLILQRSADAAVDFACAPGGMVVIGTHKDRQKKLNAPVKEFPSSDHPAAVAADCFGAFHRKKDAEAYRKTPKLQAELDRLFALRPKCCT